MNRLLKILAWILFWGGTAFASGPCQEFVVPYNTASTVSVCLKKYDSSASNDNEKMALKTDITFAAGEVKVNLDHGGEANIGTLPSDRGSCYDFPLSTSETSGKEGYVTFIDASSPKVWIDGCIEYRTYGNASAFYTLPNVSVAQWNGTNVASPDTAGYPKCTIKDGTGTGEVDTNAGAVVSVTTAGTCSALANNSVTAAAIANDAIGATEIADGAIDAATLATDTITAAKIAAGAITSSEAPNLDAAVSSVSGGGSSAVGTGTFQTSSGPASVKLASGDTKNYRKGQVICGTSGNNNGQCSTIIYYNFSTKVASIFPAFTNAPANTETYAVYPSNYVLLAPSSW